MNSKYNKSIRGKLFRYYKQRLGIKLSTKGWYRSNCPYCGGNYCFGINFTGYKTKCFKCEETSNPIATLMHMEGFETQNQVWAMLKLEQEYDGYEDSAGPVRLVKSQVILPESFKLIITPDGFIGKAAQRYMTKKRGFDLTKLAMQGVGYCTEGKYTGYIIFPFYRKTELVFFQGRLFIGDGPKMQNPGNEEFGIGKTSIIYNHDALFIYDRINIVESITNALTLGDNTIAILGKSISPYQLAWLMRSPATHYTILLDDDALIKATELAMTLCPYKQVRLVKMPKGKDVNDLGKKATVKLMKLNKFYGYEGYRKFFKIKQDAQGPVDTSKRIRPSYSHTRGA